MHAETLIFDNGARPRRRPRLSVLIPFRHRDPTRLIEGLGALETPMEVVVLDNGSGDSALAERVTAAILRLKLPARFVRLAAKAGRATARNRLALEARAERRLFLDAESIDGDEPGFVAHARALVERADNQPLRRHRAPVDQVSLSY